MLPLLLGHDWPNCMYGMMPLFCLFSIFHHSLPEPQLIRAAAFHKFPILTLEDLGWQRQLIADKGAVWVTRHFLFTGTGTTPQPMTSSFLIISHWINHWHRLRWASWQRGQVQLSSPAMNSWMHPIRLKNGYSPNLLAVWICSRIHCYQAWSFL